VSNSTWTGGRRRLKKPKKETVPTLVVADPNFFAKRDKRGFVPKEFEYSEDMLRAARAKFDLIVVFERRRRKIRDRFSKFLESLGIDGVRVVEYTGRDVETITSAWKTTLMEMGASFRRVRNPREITYLNLANYMNAPHITWVGPDDHKKIKINLEKDKTFKELQEERRKRAEW